MGVNLQNIEPLTATSKINHSLIKTMHPPSPYTRGGSDPDECKEKTRLNTAIPSIYQTIRRNVF